MGEKFINVIILCMVPVAIAGIITQDFILYDESIYSKETFNFLIRFNGASNTVITFLPLLGCYFLATNQKYKKVQKTSIFLLVTLFVVFISSILVMDYIYNVGVAVCIILIGYLSLFNQK